MLRSAESQLFEKQLLRDQQIRATRTAISSDVVALESSRVQKKTLEQAYQKSKASYDLQLREYRLGLVNNLEVIQALNTLLDMKRSLDKTDVQMVLNAIQLKIDRQELP